MPHQGVRRGVFQPPQALEYVRCLRLQKIRCAQQQPVAVVELIPEVVSAGDQAAQRGIDQQVGEPVDFRPVPALRNPLRMLVRRMADFVRRRGC